MNLPSKSVSSDCFDRSVIFPVVDQIQIKKKRLNMPVFADRWSIGVDWVLAALGKASRKA
jgi:hypothetical protein